MKISMAKNIALGALLVIILVAYQNCGKKMSFASLNSSLPTEALDLPAPEDLTPPPADAVVCGGLGNGSPGIQKFGIIGNIYVSDKASDPGAAYKYPTEATPLKSSSGDLISMYLNNINVPTRSFTEGFVNQNGQALTDTNNNVLIEYFGLKLRFSLILPDEYEEGFYQLGIESDDGSIIQTLNAKNEMVTLIDNDKTQSTTAKCATEAIYFDHTTRIPSELYYFQGPRTEIALRLAWKKVDNERPSSVCGSLGTLDGSAKSNFWTVIPSTAYELPISEQTNPCTNN